MSEEETGSKFDQIVMAFFEQLGGDKIMTYIVIGVVIAIIVFYEVKKRLNLHKQTMGSLNPNLNPQPQAQNINQELLMNQINQEDLSDEIELISIRAKNNVLSNLPLSDGTQEALYFRAIVLGLAELNSNICINNELLKANKSKKETEHDIDGN